MRRRLNLARVLFMPSDVLLLDEPTNHLDVESVAWLEGVLKKYSGIILLISHDRDFLDNVVDSVAEIENKNVLYLYENRGVYVFCDPKNRAERFELSPDVVGDAIKFVPVNTELDAMVYEEEIIGVTIPIKMQLKVKESAPAVKGNTSSGATKDAILETGARVQVPLFINEGDIVSINTEEGIYSERVEKA